MNLTKKIQRKIERKLNFTNGWAAIESDKYSLLCKELAEEVILEIEKDWNKRKNKK